MSVTVVNIIRTRGDTFPVRFTLVDAAGVAVDITGFTGFLLTVDPSSEPTGPGNNLFQSIGAIVGAPTAGVFEYPISLVDSDQTPEVYFYDAQFTDAGGSIRTISRGKWTVEQDVTK